MRGDTTVSEARIDPLIARDSEVSSSISTHTANASAHHTGYTNAEAVAAIKAADGSGSGLDADLLDGQHASAFVSSGQVYTKAEVDSLLSALQSRIAALEAKLSGLTRSGNDIIITGANLHIRSGSGSTSGTINGLGNLTVGYNELRVFDDNIRTGSHNLIVGTNHNYSSYGGIVFGNGNTISGSYASVSGGYYNTASGGNASVSGGYHNTASGYSASVSGGNSNTASGHYSSVSGGYAHGADGESSSVSGGFNNQANAPYSSVSGGDGNNASGTGSSISGGAYHTVTGWADWAAGGLFQQQ